MDQRYWRADAGGHTLSSPSLPPAEPCCCGRGGQHRAVLGPGGPLRCGRGARRGAKCPEAVASLPQALQPVALRCGAAAGRPGESSGSQEDPTSVSHKGNCLDQPRGSTTSLLCAGPEVCGRLPPSQARGGSKVPVRAEARGAWAGTRFVSNVAPFPIAL